MNLLCLDIEMNQPSGKIIQIGACAFDSNTGQILDVFSTFVNIDEPLTDFIKTLTGITDDDLEFAPGLDQAYLDFIAFHKQYKCQPNPVVWGSGRFNDATYLEDRVTSEAPRVMGFRVMDTKTLYQTWALLNGHSGKAGLTKAVKNFRLEFKGRAHNALNDSINTARLFHRLSQFFKEKSTNG